MIKVGDKSQCCGCEACRSVCPKICISMKADKEGFLYPEVDLSQCIDCKLCEKVCPVLQPAFLDRKPKVFAGINNDIKIRLQSSSGGIFTLLAEQTLHKGGVVFGACFDEQWNVVHNYTDTVEGLARFRGSKYVQSSIGDSFLQAKKFLDEGREVLFSGTPCQIAGLKNFLQKPYQNLLTVDVVCHGVPSPEVWKKYLERTVCKAYNIRKRDASLSITDKIENINFRLKEKGWKKYHIRIKYKNGKQDVMPFYENTYMKVFLSNLSLRPSCYCCPAKGEHVQSDITIADFWGVDKIMPEIDDDNGCSLILINNLNCLSYLQYLGMKYSPQVFSEVIPYNPNIMQSVTVPVNRKFFFYIFICYGFDMACNLLTNRGLLFRIIRYLYRFL